MEGQLRGPYFKLLKIKSKTRKSIYLKISNLFIRKFKYMRFPYGCKATERYKTDFNFV